MADDHRNHSPALGFLTVVAQQPHGLLGGYLLLNASGRPLEFHCTAPVKPNRAQEILFGPTLQSYLYGEQIGQALAAKASHPPLVLLTDMPAMLALRPFVAQPLVLVLPADGGERPARAGGGIGAQQAVMQADGDAAIYRVDASHTAIAGLHTFPFGRNRLALGTAHGEDRALVCERLQAVGETFDLIEPFGRIRAAIDEAQRGGR